MSNNLAKFRKRCGLTQLALASRSGVSPQYVRLIEQGGLTPGVDISEALGKALGLPSQQLFPLLRLRDPGLDRFQQLQHSHPEPIKELSAQEKRMIQDTVGLMPKVLFEGFLHSKWAIVLDVILAYAAHVKKFKPPKETEK
ncbi:MAG: helix-turn-helix transcriptional regulator [Candidatus Aminicenantales bacterium]